VITYARPDIWITHLGHAVPGRPYAQTEVATWMEPRLAPGSNVERFHRFMSRSGIRVRHSVIDVFGSEGEAFFPLAGAKGPDARVRSRVFDQRAIHLAVDAVKAACPDGVPAGITHVVVATCTGAVAPGLDIQLVQALGLSPNVRRTMVGFMGCYAAMPALRVARDACLADPSSKALVVCCELSSLHLQAGPDDDALLGASLFGDGASAAVVQAGDAPVGCGLRFVNDLSVLVPDSSTFMAWEAGPEGFVLKLSPLLTRSLSNDIDLVANGLLGPGTPATAVRWAIHPGGPRILHDVQRKLALPDSVLASSHHTLAEGGNRSSGTILAIIQEELRQPWSGRLGTMAFGPGLTAEAMLFER